MPERQLATKADDPVAARGFAHPNVPQGDATAHVSSSKHVGMGTTPLKRVCGAPQLASRGEGAWQPLALRKVVYGQRSADACDGKNPRMLYMGVPLERARCSRMR